MFGSELKQLKNQALPTLCNVFNAESNLAKIWTKRMMLKQIWKFNLLEVYILHTSYSV